MRASEKIMSEKEWRMFIYILISISFINYLAEMKLQRDWERKDTISSSNHIKIIVDKSELIEIKIKN
jgi:hypothetical protein